MSLNRNNYLNLFGYLLNVAVTFGASSIFGFPDNAELSAKYQTIVTPAGAAFAIWGVIFLAQAAFVVSQMLPQNRENDMVQGGISYWYFVACLFQSAWTFAFGYELVGLSCILMFGILVSLSVIVFRQAHIHYQKEGLSTIRGSDCLLYEFPFSIHTGWISAAFAVNVNVAIVATGQSSHTQISFAYASIVYAMIIAITSISFISPPVFTIPYVLVWATMWIVIELNHPADKITATFTENQISHVRHAFLLTCILLCVSSASYGLYKVISRQHRSVPDGTSYRAI